MTHPAMKPSPEGLSAMLCAHGQGVVKGYAIGRAAVMSAAALEVAHYRIAPEDVQAECERLDNAMRTARQELTPWWRPCRRRAARTGPAA